jgi:hypothetical protein
MNADAGEPHDTTRRFVSSLLMGAVLAVNAAPVLAGAAAVARYREGLPEVLAPPTAQPTRPVEDQFRATYARAGRPRVVIYWNRELDDELVDRKAQHVDIRAAAIETGPVALGAVRVDTAESIANRAAAGGVPRRLAAVETAFVQLMAQQGVRLADRAAILRIEHARARKGKSAAATDTRTNEIDALSAHADLLIEIVVLEAGIGPDALEFKLLAKDTRSGAMPFSLTTRARGLPNATESGFSADESGFVRKVAPPRSMHDVGRQLAIDTMAAWNAAQLRK